MIIAAPKSVHQGVFASDNGPQGQTAREHGNQGTPGMGNSGPFRGELGEVTEGAIRTAAIIRWPGKVKPNTTTYAMFSIMDFLPTFAHIVGGNMPTDRAIDGVDQIDVLLGSTAIGRRESLLSFIGADLVAARWKQWRIYFTETFKKVLANSEPSTHGGKARTLAGSYGSARCAAIPPTLTY
jgi:arylsulfatase